MSQHKITALAMKIKCVKQKRQAQNLQLSQSKLTSKRKELQEKQAPKVALELATFQLAKAIRQRR